MLAPLFIFNVQMDIVDRLVGFTVSGDLINHYSLDDPLNQVRRHNLRLYLEQMIALQPNVLLVGEAPGYKGCRLTGVPFTSERILLQGLNAGQLFGQANGFRKTTESRHTAREATATIVWQTLGEQDMFPLLWNVLPFHPHQPGEPWSNRTPTIGELQVGEGFLRELLEIFSIEIIVAVGRKAKHMLNLWNLSAFPVRHPAHGGKKAFTLGIKEVIHRQGHRHRHPDCGHHRQ